MYVVLVSPFIFLVDQWIRLPPPFPLSNNTHNKRSSCPMAASTASIVSSSSQPLFVARSSSTCITGASVSKSYAYTFLGAPLKGYRPKKGNIVNVNTKVRAVSVATPVVEETKVYSIPTWAAFELGRAPVYWKTTNGLPPTSGEKLSIFYNPSANKMSLNEEYGIAFNGGFNQPIMCGGEPRKMHSKVRGKADPPMFSINICVPKHAVSLIFSFTNGVDWDGPYKLLFQVPKAWRNKPIKFFNEGLAEELGKDGACEQAIYPESEIVVTRCAMVGNLTLEGGDRCNLDFVVGCTDPSSPSFNPLANVDDGCPMDMDSEV